MPNQKPRDFSATIKKILTENQRTVEFFALSLTLMLSMPEEDRDAIAKSCATEAAKHYYDLNFCNDAKTRKAIQQSFQKTLFATLTQDFDYKKAGHFIQIYTSTEKFQKQSQENIERNRSPYQTIKNVANNRCIHLHRVALAFAKKLNDEHLKHIETHINFNPLDFFIREDTFKGNIYYRLLPILYLTSFIAALFLFIHQINNFRLDMTYNEHSKVTPFNLALLAFIEIVMLYLVQRIAVKLIIPGIDKHFLVLSETLTQELIKAINVSLVPAKQNSANDKTTVYHFSLFDLPSLSKQNPTQPATTIHPTPERRTQCKIKTRPAFTVPVAEPQPNALKTLENSLMINHVEYHRLFNSQGIPTHDFIGLDAAKIPLNKQAMKKIDPILNHPQLVAKKGESGILNITDEKRKLKNQSHHTVGLFKIKHKAMDERFYTAEKTQTQTLNGEDITLHTVNISKRHVSRKNH